MDPNACLEEALRNASRIIEELSSDEIADDAVQLATNVLALHDWIRGGGFLPNEWRRK